MAVARPAWRASGRQLRDGEGMQGREGEGAYVARRGGGDPRRERAEHDLGPDGDVERVRRARRCRACARSASGPEGGGGRGGGEGRTARVGGAERGVRVVDRRLEARFERLVHLRARARVESRIYRRV